MNNSLNSMNEPQNINANIPWVSLAERYTKGWCKLHIHINTWNGAKHRASLNRPRVYKRLYGQISRQYEASMQHADDAYIEAPVFISVAKLPQGPKRSISCVVRLETVNECLSGLGYPPEAFRLATLIFRGSFEDGELMRVGRGFSIQKDQPPDEVVKRAPEIVNSISQDKAGIYRDGRGSESSRQICCLASRLI